MHPLCQRADTTSGGRRSATARLPVGFERFCLLRGTIATCCLLRGTVFVPSSRQFEEKVPSSRQNGNAGSDTELGQAAREGSGEAAREGSAIEGNHVADCGGDVEVRVLPRFSVGDMQVADESFAVGPVGEPAEFDGSGMFER